MWCVIGSLSEILKLICSIREIVCAVRCKLLTTKIKSNNNIKDINIYDNNDNPSHLNPRFEIQLSDKIYQIVELLTNTKTDSI